MFAKLHVYKLIPRWTAFAAAALLALLSLLTIAVCTTYATQILNPEMPQILQQVSAQMPADWHPRQMHNGDVHLHNPLQRLNAQIDRHGIHLKVQDRYRLNMRLLRFGFNGRLKIPQAGRADIDGVRVDVMHAAGLCEWFINTPLGIEQGFTLMPVFAESQKETDASGSHLFELHFELGGDLIPELTAQGLDFKDRNGRVKMHYNHLLAFDAQQQILPARFALAANHLTITVDTSGAVFPLTIDPLFSSEQSLTASDAAAEDQFGDAVAVDGDTIVIGAPLDNSGTSTDSGAAYVFVRDPSTGVFSEQQKLTASDAAAEDNFGSAVDVDGHTIVVGAPLVNSGTSPDTGAIYVFTRDPTDPTDPWTEQQKLSASDEASGDRLGTSVYLEGNTVVGGAPRKDDGTTTAAGAAYVFSRDPDDATDPWTEQQKLTADDASAEDQFGTSVSLNGNTIVVGAPLDNLGTSFDAGSLYVFTRDQALSSDPWTQQQKLTASNAGADDRLGTSVSIDANTILAGAPREDTAGFVDSGAAYIFTRSSASAGFSEKEILRATFTGSDFQFGTSVFVEGATAMIGAPLERILTSTDAGAAYHFVRDPQSGDWSQQQRLTGSSPEAQAEFGGAVGISAGTAILGSAKRNQGTSTSAGAAFVFVSELLSDEISQETDILTADDAAANDAFGSAVGLSGDNTLIGLPKADSGGDLNTGAVSAFERNPNNQVFDDEATLKAGDKAAFDTFGAAVSVDADIAVVGAPDDNVGADADAGSAYIFTRNSTNGDWDQTDQLDAGADVDPLDKFGSAVAIDGDVILIGVPFHNPGAVPDGGAAFLFSRNPAEAAANQWTETDKLTAGIDEDMDDRFGTAVALNSDTALIGAPFEDNGGAVFVFVRNPDDNSWTRQQKLTAADSDAGDQFGYSVTVFGNTAIIGAPQADVTGGIAAGAVYIFTRDPSDVSDPWTERQKLEGLDPAIGDAFGTAVSLVGDIAVIGAPGVDLPLNMMVRVDAGAAYDFRRDPDTGEFNLLSELTASDAMADEAFGTVVIVACDTIIIGAPDVDLGLLTMNAGAVFVFQTFEDEGDSNGRRSSSSGSGTCFIDTLRSDLELSTAVYLLAAAIFALVLTLLRYVGCRKIGVRRQR